MSAPFLWALLLHLLPSCASQGDWRDVAHDLDAMIEASCRGRVQVAAKVVALETGEVVYARHPELLLHPASTMKLLTVATALWSGAADRQATTTLRGAADGQGPLYLHGGGDPFLAAADLRGIVRQLEGRGIERVTGPLVVDASLFGGPRFGFGWMWDDEPAGFMPHISALTVEGGCVLVTVRAEGGGGGGDARTGRPVVSVGPASEHVHIVNLATSIASQSDAEGGVIIDRNWRAGGRTITVSGRLRPGQMAERRLSVPRPEMFAGRVLKSFLEERGLAGPALDVVGLEASASGSSLPPPPGDEELARVDRSFEEIITRLTKASDNLAAECLLRLLAVERGVRPYGAEGPLEIVRSYVRELGREPAAYRLVDGSGLSHLNLVSADLLVALLVDMHRRTGVADLFRAALPVAGVDGTLSRRMRETAAANNLRAKTGTLSGVSALVGYVRTAAGEPLAFAFLVQNFVGTSAPWRDLVDRLGVRLAEAGRD